MKSSHVGVLCATNISLHLSDITLTTTSTVLVAVRDSTGKGKSMKLIDADGIINTIEQQAGCATCDNYNGIRCRACQWDDAITSIYDYADYHTIDAIPIEWIFDWENRYMNALPPEFQGETVIELFMEDWRKEQVKQNDS